MWLRLAILPRVPQAPDVGVTQVTRVCELGAVEAGAVGVTVTVPAGFYELDEQSAGCRSRWGLEDVAYLLVRVCRWPVVRRAVDASYLVARSDPCS
jgi:hypothetical protein